VFHAWVDLTAQWSRRGAWLCRSSMVTPGGTVAMLHRDLPPPSRRRPQTWPDAVSGGPRHAPDVLPAIPARTPNGRNSCLTSHRPDCTILIEQ